MLQVDMDPLGYWIVAKWRRRVQSDKV